MNQPSRAAQAGRLVRVLPGRVQARLFLLIALALLPLLLLLGWIYYQRYQIRLSQAMQTEMEVAQGVATTFAAYVEGIQRQNHALGQAILTFSPFSEARAAHLLSHAAQYPAVRNLSWVSPQGEVLASSLPEMVGRDLSVRLYFQEVLAGKPWAIGDLLPRGAATRAPTVGIATAVLDEGGVLRGVVVAGVEPTRLHELALTQQRPSGGEYSLYDRQGVLIYHSSGGSLTWEQRINWLAGDTLLQRMLESGVAQAGILRLESPADEWIAARVPVAGAGGAAGIGWVAGASRSVDIALAPVRRGLLLDGLLALLVLALAFLLASLLARTISGPLLRLERDAQAMGAGEMITAPDPLAPTEVILLRSTVEEMASGLIQRAEALHGAHERAAWLARFPDENPNPVMRVSAAGIILYSNSAAAQLPGWNYQVGQQIADPLLPIVERAMAQAAEVQQDVQLGQKFYSVSAMPFPREEYANLYGRDVTERKLAEQALQAYAGLLECSNRDLQEFAFMASHDLQEPLRKIDILGDMVLQGSADLDQRQRDSLVRMRRAANRMRSMVDGLLQFSLATARGQAFEPVALSQTVAKALAELEFQILQVEARVEVEPLPVIEADPVQMIHLFQNLVENALKFHRPGVPPVVRVYSRRVEGRGIGDRDNSSAQGALSSTIPDPPQPRTPFDFIEIFIEDNGIGFDEVRARRLFQPFQRLVERGENGGAEVPGIGIGLAICRRIVERHGGGIRARGAAGQGATFIVTLPVTGSKILN